MSIRPLQTTEETVPALAMEPGRCPPPQKAAAAAYPKGIAAAELLAAEADTSFGSTVKARARTRLQYVGNRPFLCATHEEKGLRARLRRQKAANPPVKWIVQDEGSPFNDPQGLRQVCSSPLGPFLGHARGPRPGGLAPSLGGFAASAANLEWAATATPTPPPMGCFPGFQRTTPENVPSTAFEKVAHGVLPPPKRQFLSPGQEVHVPCH